MLLIKQKSTLPLALALPDRPISYTISLPISPHLCHVTLESLLTLVLKVCFFLPTQFWGVMIEYTTE